MSSTRDATGRFVPGHAPTGGRPKGFRGVSRLIMSETRDGAELVEWALKMFRDDKAEVRDRSAAHQWLSDRGLGKAIATLELHNGDARDTDDDTYAALPEETLRELLAAHDRTLCPTTDPRLHEPSVSDDHR